MPRKQNEPKSVEWSEKMITRLIDTLNEMYAGISLIPFSEPPRSKLRQEYWTQCRRLREKLKEVGGEIVVESYDAVLTSATKREMDIGWFGGAGHNFDELTEIQLHHEVFLDREFKLPRFGTGPCNHPNAEKLYAAAHGMVREHMHLALGAGSHSASVSITPAFLESMTNLFIEAGHMIMCMRPSSSNPPVKISTIASWSEAVSTLFTMVNILITIRPDAERESEIRANWELCRVHLNGRSTTIMTIESYLQGIHMVLFELARKMREHVTDRIQMMAASLDDKFIEYEKKYYLTQKQTTITRKWMGAVARNSAKMNLSAQAIHSQAIVDLISGEFLPQETDFVQARFPETMLLDFERCGMLRCEFTSLIRSHIALIAAVQTNCVAHTTVYLEKDGVGSVLRWGVSGEIELAVLDRAVNSDSTTTFKALRARLCKLLLEANGEKKAAQFFPEVIDAPNLKKRLDTLVWWVGRIKVANFAVHKELYEQIVASA